ncbi:hypothetical protein JGH11_19830 [Dysgonomonas sp. Marseille-P4677]|uniref:hypothetical protein n=1 Tax=Dysgonomonas sp. Marseille-P4677 TaxID=2364790 RepID=UPI00191240CB|nr:hypothetical protein [Dysgonomonas sp. Marseille-P4677]MBK5723121.1 hypothetical protein [Dysgonomonas sp. Marseille-P4677]
MKKHIITILFFLVGISVMGQGHYIISHVFNPDQRHYYVGSLAEASGSVYQKLKLDVFGGIFTGTSSGTSSYSITTRSANIINVNKTGGSDSGYELKVYKNGTKYDFVIQINVSYVSLFVQSWLINGPLDQITLAKPIDIVRYNPEGKTDATHWFTKKNMLATDQDGNIGLGTLPPQSKLDVRGKIIAKEVEIKINDGADFVFSPSYSLKPLSEVEIFEKENRHLPDIPSEKQMQENGFNLNDMQIRLLRKIEELALYVINQDKRIQALEQENRQLKTVQP